MSKSSKKTTYHHGDLRSSLVETGAEMIKEAGIEGLSLRKLAERIGVSRTATYHHFNNKNDLLCAIAALGFAQWQEISEQIFDNSQLSGEEQFRQFVYKYIQFATQNPSIYELMFGKTIWKNNNSDQALRDIAYPSFNYQLEMTKVWQQQGLLIKDENSLRLAQVTWGALHGIVRLLIDGIYLDTSHTEEMCECVVKVFMQSTKNNKA